MFLTVLGCLGSVQSPPKAFRERVVATLVTLLCEIIWFWFYLERKQQGLFAALASLCGVDVFPPCLCVVSCHSYLLSE